MSRGSRRQKVLSEKFHAYLTATLVFLIIFLVILTCKLVSNSSGKDVRGPDVLLTRLGEIRGKEMTTRKERKIMSYRGIRYGKAPVKELKFKVSQITFERIKRIFYKYVL